MTNYTVTTLADENDGGATVGAPGGTGLSLREALTLANAQGGADTIDFAAGLSGGTLHLASTLAVTDAVTIHGDTNGDNVADVTISGDASSNDIVVAGLTDIAASTNAGTLGDNVQIIASSADLTLDRLTLTGGVADIQFGQNGGAVNISNAGAILTVNYTTIGGNLATTGGGVYSRGDVILSNSSVTSNTGGGIIALGDVTLSASSVGSNRSASGGAGILANGDVLLTGSIVSGNTSEIGGGGIVGTHVTLIDSAASGNNAGHAPGQAGGGIYANEVTLINSNVNGNSAGEGGGIYTTGNATITNSTVSGNSAIENGGGMRIDGAATLSGSTISGNFAGADGGGIYATLSTGAVVLTNTTISGNGAINGAGALFAIGGVSLTNSIILGNSSSNLFSELNAIGTLTALGLNIVGLGTDTTGSDGIINAASVAAVFASVDSVTGGGLLANNGGPGWTIELAYSLLNPALDSGTDSLAPATDARGFDRTIDQTTIPNTGPNISDLGAIELQGQTGGAGNDPLLGTVGNDVLSGGGGIDTLTGGLGNDTYLNPLGDIIVELPGQGIDIVYSNVAYSLGAIANVENLTLTGAAAINGTGNALNNVITGNSAANILRGFGGNDILTGGAGADTLEGGAGNDTYVDPTGDTIVEAVNQGIDTVTSAATFSIETIANVERLFLTGTAAIDGTGNALANLLLGNDAANTLTGRDGDDTINGGGGADTVNGGSGLDRLIGGLQRDKIFPGADNVQDTIVYSAVGESTGQTRDIVVGLDLNGEDKLDLPGAVTAIAAPVSGALSLATFNANLTSALTAAALPVGNAVLFTPTSGDLANPIMVYLIVDANGVAGYQANQDWVFQLESHTGTLDTSDFI